MAIATPPDIPLITDPATFAVRAQDWVVWQAEQLYPALVDAGTVVGLSTTATSTTSNTIGTGSKSFTVETGKGFVAGQSLSIAYTTDPTNRMFCVVTSYNSGTGALVVTSQAFEGSGTYTAWSIATAINAIVNQAQIGTNVVGKGPAFSAYASVSQSIASATQTKVTLGIESYDTNSNFSSSRFTATVSGYYFFTGTLRGSATNLTNASALIYLNGALFRQCASITIAANTSTQALSFNEIIFLNSSDYVELYGIVSGTTPEFNTVSSASTSFLSGVLVRAV